MAESQRGKLTGRKIVRRIKDSVSVSDGRSSRSRSSGSSRSSSSGGISATVKREPETKRTFRASSTSRLSSARPPPPPVFGFTRGQIRNRQDILFFNRLEKQKQKEKRKKAIDESDRPTEVNLIGPTVKDRRVPKTSSAFLLGAKATAKLRSQTEEERRKEPLPVQISQGVAEGIGQTAFVLGSAPIVVGEDIKNLIEGKPFRPEGNFFEQVLKETRPSTLSQGLSQITPGAKREPLSFDPTSLSRAGGEITGLFAGAKLFNIGTPKIPISSGPTQARPSFGFTRTKITTGAKGVRTFARGEGPSFPVSQPQLSSSINLGQGVGKTILRKTPPRSPFLDDVLGRTKSEVPFRIPKQGAFKGSDFGLGKGATKIIEGTAKQTQQTGLRTLVKTKQTKTPKIKSELDILRQKPRFTSTKIRAGESSFETIRFPKSAKSLKPIAGAVALGGAASIAIGQSSKAQPSFKLNAIPKSTFKFTDALKTQKGTRATSSPKSDFRFRDDTSFKLTTTPKLDTPFRQITTTRLSPPQKPPRVPVRPVFGFPPFGRPAGFTSFGRETKGSTRSVFGAFAISENINIGRLPGPLSEFSRSPKVFKKLDKRDREFQEAIFGKPRRKSKSKKGSKKKRKR